MLKAILKYFLFFSLILNALLAQGQHVVNLADFGVEPGSHLNASPAIKKAIESCKGKSNIILKLPEGRIDIWPEGAEKRELYISNATENDSASKEKTIGFWFEEISDIILEGNNTLVVAHGKMVLIGALHCTNLTVRNLSFDFERPTMSELTVISVSHTTVVTEIHPDSRFSVIDDRIVFFGEGWRSQTHHTVVFDPEKKIMRYGSFQPFLNSKATLTAPLKVRFDGDFSNLDIRPGDILTIRDPYRDNCGLFISRCKNILIEDVNLHYMHGLGVVSQFSENISLRKVTVAPRAETGRIVAAFADCFHFSGCRGLVEVDSCFTSGSHDDPINVHGTHLKITSTSLPDKLIVRFMHHQTYGFEAFFEGDSIAVTDPQTLLPLSLAKVKTARMISKREMELVLDGKIPETAREGLAVENLTWTPEVRITNSRFEQTNTRGLLITTRRNVLIENNTFFHTGMSAVLIADDASNWYESGAVTDVTLRNNRFEDCGYNQQPGNYIIAVTPENHKLINNSFVHRNIRIENNTFISFDNPVLTCRSVDNLVFTGNRMISSGLLPAGDGRAAFSITASRKVLIEHNIFPEGWNSSSEIHQMKPKEIKTDVLLIHRSSVFRLFRPQ